MINIIKDVAELTTIPEKTIMKLCKKLNYCICDAAVEAKLAGNPIVEMDIGIGILYIKITDPSLKFHFEPNDLLRKNLSQSLESNENILDSVLNETLAKKFKNTYKDLCE